MSDVRKAPPRPALSASPATATARPAFALAGASGYGGRIGGGTVIDVGHEGRIIDDPVGYLWLIAARRLIRTALEARGAGRDVATRYLIERGLVAREELESLPYEEIEARARRRIALRAPE